MAVNLQTKFGDKIANKFYLDSVVAGKTSKEFTWEGANTIRVIAPTTQAMKTYDPTATSSRFGGLAEMQDTYQDLALTQDKSFDIGIDKVNFQEGNKLKAAAKMLALQNREQAIPQFDAYCLAAWAGYTGIGSHVQATLTKSNIMEEIGTGIAALVNGKVNVTEGVYLYIGATAYSKLVASPEWVGTDTLNNKATEKGVIGMVRGLKVVQVPDSYLPTGVHFLIVKKDSVVAPMTIKTLRMLEDDADLDGVRLQGRYRYDAYVIDGRKAGVFKCVASAA